VKKFLNKLILTFVLLSVGTAGSGCTRLMQKEAGVSINLSLSKSNGGPGMQTINGSEVQHLVVNIDGPEDFFLDWDHHESSTLDLFL